ncbi:hypothetical protein PHYBOEH_008264 [Phytophthora boehmeriae]|uniref:Kinesin-like protein n=1 Tax=Phytophthora boehmeriae TaxID=109152 RepID=A0A8T1W5C4_9STRA|nr:hypothetical protein PHYBOEH_008264 [Phytophthora boehmeriae]
MNELRIKLPLSPSKKTFERAPPVEIPPPLVSRVRVAVRVRPPKNNSGDDLCVAVAESNPEDSNTVNFQHESASKTFRFDHVFSPESVQSDVYNEALQPMLASLLFGFNVTVLAYGQTGSGKTHTMGRAITSSSKSSQVDEGLIPRFLRDLFTELRSEPTVKTTAQVSFAEIYCDEIRDLLAEECPINRLGSRSRSASSLAVHEDDQEVWVGGLQQVKVKNVDEALDLLNTGRQRQTTGAHALNDQSSRSHVIYTLEILRAFADELKCAKLTFVDLAGSERVKKTLVEGQSLKESIQINVGLLALGNVINALGNQQRALRRQNAASSDRRRNIIGVDTVTPVSPAHIPYRSSKLTRLLRDALGGNSVTLFMYVILLSISID